VQVVDVLTQFAQFKEHETQLTPLENVPVRQVLLQELPESRRGGEQLRQLLAVN
jgi:hypothetical protein